MAHRLFQNAIRRVLSPSSKATLMAKDGGSVCLARRSLMQYDHLRDRIQDDTNFIYDRDELIPEILGEAVSSMHLSASTPMAMFLDLGRFRQRCNELLDAFQSVGLSRATHAMAVKALPLEVLLKESYALGLGAECASKGEVDLSLGAGMPVNRIVFDSPCKTIEELVNCLSKGLYLNVDNFQELNRVRSLLEDLFPQSGVRTPVPRVGVRVNPCVGMGSIGATSTAHAHSKFGVNIDQYRDELIFAFRKFDWLNAVHCHIGSQGCPLQMIVDGVRKTVEFAEEVNEICVDGDDELKIQTIDIGGGLPINYLSNEDTPSFYDLAYELKRQVPVLFDAGERGKNKYHIFTEFGRSLVQKTGWIASKVEYTKQTGEKNIATVHAGGHILLRTAYQPDTWQHHITVHNPDGSPKEGHTVKYDIAGPLCFSGDLIAVDRDLPPIEPGDWIVIHDAGGYSYCMYSRYNSRPAPPIYGYDEDTDCIKILKAGENSMDVCNFWQS